METKKNMSVKEVIEILTRMQFEEDFKNLPERRDALSFAIEAIKELDHYKKNLIDDRK